jgi:3-hydroxy-9,10-secoandrosta-1,3,5(10)-triene-9,17-dione monooxygenase reductase component
VHVLAADQEELSNRFATRGEDKFGGLALEQGVGDIPLLPGCAARFQCRTAFQYEGGDHIILVGEVIAFDRSDSPPLVFHGGRYAFATQKLPSKTPPRVDELAGSFSEDFLGYLLGRAHFQFYRRLGSVLTEVGITDEQHFILATLTVAEPMSAAELDRLISFFLQSPLQPALEDLQGRGFLAVSTDATGALSYALTPAGHDAALRLIAAAKAVESQVTEHIGYADSAVLKTLLRRLVELTDPGLPKLWNADDDG